MDRGDYVTFCQSDLPSVSFAAFEDIRRSEQFCDLSIKVQNHSFPAHRMVIAAVIPYFQSLITSDGAETGKKEITVENLDATTLEALIDFAYTSKVKISSENAQSLLATSQVLKLNQVCEACVQFLTGRLNVNNVVKIREFGCDIKNPHLIENCYTWIRHNFEEFSKCPDFLSLPHSFVKAVISDDDLKVSNEEVVFDSVIAWVKNSSTERQLLLPDLLSEVRLTFLSTEYFMDKIDADVLINDSAPCRDLVNEAKYYQFLPKRKSLLTNLKTQPRNYWWTLYSVGSCLSCGPCVHFFDFMEDMWLPLAVNKAECKMIYSAICVNEEIYLFLQERILLFSLKSAEWKVLKCKHDEIEGAAIASHEDRIYCFGSAKEKEVRYFDIQDKQWVPKGEMNTHLPYSAAVSLGEWVYLTGGGDIYIGGRYACYNTVEKYMPTTGEWSLVPSMMTGRSNHACASLDGKIYVCGGLNSARHALNTAEVYDPDANEWISISPATHAMSCFSLVAHCNKIYALGKSGGEIYDPKTDEWKCSSSVVPAGFIGAFSTAAVLRLPKRYIVADVSTVHD